MIRIFALALLLAPAGPIAAQDIRLNIVQDSFSLRKSEIVYAQAFFRHGHWVVEIRFSFLAAGKIREITSRNEFKQMQIVVDSQVLAESHILRAIDDGMLVVEGNFTEARAKEIAAKLR